MPRLPSIRGWSVPLQAVAGASRSVSLLFLTLLLPACKKQAPEVPAAPITIHFTCDTFGRLEPCGCFTGQHGGLTRLRSWLQAKDQEGTSIRLDAGDALAGTEDYDVIQYEYLLQGYAAMGFKALNMGAREAQLDAETLATLADTSPVPMISASLVDPDSRKPILPAYTILNYGERRIAILGLLDPASCPAPGSGVAVLDMPEAVDRILPELSTKADAIFVLAFTTEAGMEQLARSYFEFDLILGGDVGGPAQKLTQTNDSLIAFTTNQGRTVGTIKATLSAGDHPRLVDPEYQMVLLAEGIPQDPELRALVAGYRKQVRETELTVDQPGSAHDPDAIPGVHSGATYVGSESCKKCHAEDHAIWASTGHGHAFETLVRRDADADPHCIKCHTVGFGEESGYRREFGKERLTDVGCESCHGPASEHVEEMLAGRPKRFQFRPLGAADCTKCHYGEFSRPFDWETFWPKVRHGKP